jgi:hypothetical protein
MQHKGIDHFFVPGTGEADAHVHKSIERAGQVPLHHTKKKNFPKQIVRHLKEQVHT